LDVLDVQQEMLDHTARRARELASRTSSRAAVDARALSRRSL
jgi:hypothetical protein